ncbi:MAG: YdeI/OmpD-associated family protein [Sphingomonas sp.]|uniref:YdeI/OmpD-associated family protein n=1 Tax=Sphingomonas sp. TaxID=28214 RepID=UPI001AD01FB7|nr:YdeI/OmpD-associated family protein [Sphingomonas sp.]MBN8808172.1 YdeI/OmpD-associated family protein [Sphingomonas sp.]
MPRDARVDAYIAGKAAFARPILIHLRDLVHATVPAIEEAIKWSMPAFLYRGRPVANMAAFKQHAGFGFWNRQAMPTGQEGEGMGQFGRLTSLADLPADAVIAAMLREAVAAIDGGTVPKRAARAAKPEAAVPPALAEALAQDALATATWQGFPPGCRCEYCEWVGDAKRDDTRARVAQTIAQLREGKRHNWRYAGC